MAGETPGAAKARKKQVIARPGTDKIYASKDRSVFAGRQATFDTVGRPGQKPAAIPTPTQSLNDKSAEKYYAEGGSGRNKIKLAALPKLPTLAKAKTARTAQTTQATGVNGPDDVAPVVARILEQLGNGATGLTISVANVKGLLGRVRTALDLAVTREEITEDQYREVRLIYMPAVADVIAEKLGTLVVEKTVDTSVNEVVTEDPLAFLNNPDEEEPAIDVSSTIATTVEVDTTKDVPDHLRHLTDDDDDSDFSKMREDAFAKRIFPALITIDNNELDRSVFTDEPSKDPGGLAEGYKEATGLDPDACVVPAEAQKALDTILTTVPLEPVPEAQVPPTDPPVPADWQPGIAATEPNEAPRVPASKTRKRRGS